MPTGIITSFKSIAFLKKHFLIFLKLTIDINLSEPLPIIAPEAVNLCTKFKTLATLEEVSFFLLLSAL